jgi:hypothetical protein
MLILKVLTAAGFREEKMLIMGYQTSIELRALELIVFGCTGRDTLRKDEQAGGPCWSSGSFTTELLMKVLE